MCDCAWRFLVVAAGVAVGDSSQPTPTRGSVHVQRWWLALNATLGISGVVCACLQCDAWAPWAPLRRLQMATLDVFPKGLYIEKAMEVARAELTRECNYVLEAENQRKFKALVGDSQYFYVPGVCTYLPLRCPFPQPSPTFSTPFPHLPTHLPVLLLRAVMKNLRAVVAVVD
jgi:hypothetical protein